MIMDSPAKAGGSKTIIRRILLSIWSNHLFVDIPPVTQDILLIYSSGPLAKTTPKQKL